MIVRKITEGFVVQTFDSDSGKFLSQSEFIVGDTSYFNDENVNQISVKNFPGLGQLYHSFGTPSLRRKRRTK